METVRPSYGRWSIESYFRDIKEELGLDVEIDAVCDIVPDTYGKDGVAILAILYRCRALHEPAYCADDVADYRWFPLDQLPENIAFESSQAALRRLLESVTADERGCP